MDRLVCLTPIFALLALWLIRRHPGTRGRGENIVMLGSWVLVSCIALIWFR